MKNCGIVGYGRIGSGKGRDYTLLPRIYYPYSIREAIEVSGEGVLSGVSDTSSLALEEVPQGVPKFDSYHEMLEKIPLDFLAVTTRAKERYSVFESGIRNGIKLFHLEKPLCTSFVQLENLTNMCRQESVQFSYGALRRHLYPYKLVKSLIDSKRYGDLKNVTINYGSTNLFWTHPHSIDLILFYVGKYKKYKIQQVMGGSLQSKIVGGMREIISDPILDSVVISFDDKQIAEITDGPAQNISLECQNYVFRINQDGREVTIQKLSENEEVIWKESELESTEGFNVVLQKLLKSNVTDSEGDIYDAMVDSFRGQELLFEICLKLYLQQTPIKRQIDRNQFSFRGMNYDGFFA